jgi:Mg-chelatase subunit ChlD
MAQKQVTKEPTPPQPKDILKPAGTAEDTQKPKIEAVFVLDTTGSMGGLIQGAKDKIWSIASTLVTGKPTPEIKIGLVAYRDHGDAYIVKTTELSDDIDAVYADLMKFQADGGGDGPESVNEALNAAMTNIKWSKDKAYRVIFLVGDFPPHMDYKDDVKYQVTCKKAAESGVIINTIQCGSESTTTPIWQDIARLAEGNYFQIAQDGGTKVIETPFDKEMLNISTSLDGTRLAYGSKEQQMIGRRQLATADSIRASASAASNADRMDYASKSGDKDGVYNNFATGGVQDLANDVAAGKVKLENIKKEDLPENLQKMNTEDIKKYVDEQIKTRKELQAKLNELTAKRTEFIAEYQNRNKLIGPNTFDSAVFTAMKNQAAKAGIKY